MFNAKFFPDNIQSILKAECVYTLYLTEDNPFIVVVLHGSTEVPEGWPPTLAEYMLNKTGVQLFYKTTQKKSRMDFSVPLEYFLTQFDPREGEGIVLIKDRSISVTGDPHPFSTGIITTIEVRKRRGWYSAVAR